MIVFIWFPLYPSCIIAGRFKHGRSSILGSKSFGCFFALQRAFVHFTMPELLLNLKSAYQRLFILFYNIFAHLTKFLIFSPLFR